MTDDLNEAAFLNGDYRHLDGPVDDRQPPDDREQPDECNGIEQR